MDAPDEGRITQGGDGEIGSEKQVPAAGFPEEDDEHPALIRASLDELMNVLIAINDQRREGVRLRESTREILKRLRAA